MKLGLYIHIPFCLRKCLYCDFVSFPAVDSVYDEYIAALCREISGKGGLFSGYTVDTIYIGGGTPSSIPSSLLAEVIGCLHTNFRVAVDAEVTMEANPGTLNKSNLLVYQTEGINRLSLGVQSFDNYVLKQAGRIHTAEQAIEAINMVLDMGLTNVNIDLMYGLPDQTQASWLQSLQSAIAMKVSHISAYGLKIEEGTPFAKEYDEGSLVLPEEQEEQAMYELAVRLLPRTGYQRYEISNYARFGAECRHNLKYWQYKPYLGFGAAAHSFIDRKRFANSSDVGEYIEQIKGGESVAGYSEIIEEELAMSEFCFLALRTAHGVDFNEFSKNFKRKFLVVYGEKVLRLKERGLVTLTAKGIALTDLGMKYGNQVFAEFLPE